MAWIIGIVIVLALGYFILGKLANSRNPKIQEMVEAGRQIRAGEREMGETLEQAKTKKHFDASDKQYDKVMDLLNEDKHRPALNLIERILADEHFDLADDVYAMDVADCFTRLAEGKSPQALLSFYDKLKSEGKAIAYAERHGHLEEMADALADSMDNYPAIKTKAALIKAVAFVRQDHPLFNHLRETGNKTLHYFLDDAASEVFGNDVWQHGENEMLSELISEIETVANGGNQKERKFDPVALVCTCAEWRKKRSGLPMDSPARLCRHLTHFFSENPGSIPENMLDYALFIQKRGAAGLDMPTPGNESRVKYACLEGEPYIFEVKGDSPWVNVRLPGGAKFGFSVREKRWAKDTAPAKAAMLEKEAAAFASTRKTI